MEPVTGGLVLGKGAVPQLNSKGGFVFGRVAGVAESSAYRGVLSNSEDHTRLLTDRAGEQSFAFNTKQGNDLGTGRVKSSPLARRDANAAYASYLNYGAEMNLGGVFHNPPHTPKRVRLFLDSPVASKDSRVLRNVFEVSVRNTPGAEAQKRLMTVSQSRQTRGRPPWPRSSSPRAAPTS